MVRPGDVDEVKRLRLFLGWAGRHAASLVELAAFLALAVGFWWVSPPLGLIVPAAVVLGLSVLSRLRGAP
jgi:hypothetical protein